MARLGGVITTGAGSPGDGWTIFNPTAPVTTGSASPGPGTMKIFVANAGSDITGNGTQANPYKTIAKGASFLRQGFDDWLLLNSGDTFTNDFFPFVSATIGNAPPGGSGMTVNPPWLTEGTHTVTGVQLITSYGTGATPIIQWDSQNAGVINGGAYMFTGAKTQTFNNVAWVNIDFYAYTRDNGNAFQTANPSFSAAAAANGNASAFFGEGHNDNWILEGNRYRFCAAFGYQGDVSSPQPPVFSLTNLIFRRNTAMYAYPGQGLYLSGATNVLIEDNILNNNGWYDPGGALQNAKNHNVYCFSNTFNVTVRHNILTGDYGGFKLDSGGTIYDNYFAYSHPTQTGAQGDTQGTGYPCITTYNVVQWDSDLSEGSGGGSGEGLKLYPSISGSILDHNIISHNNSAGPDSMFKITGPDTWATASAASGSNSLTVTDPNWSTGDPKAPWYFQPGLPIQNANLPAGTVVVSASGWVTSNTGTVIVSNNTTGVMTNSTLTTPATGCTATNNISYGYAVAHPGTNGIFDNGVGTILSGNVYDPTGSNVEGYLDPTRSIETYAVNVLGRTVHTGSDARAISNQFQEVMQLVYFNRTKANWDTRLTSKVLCNYIRTGFNFPQL